MKRCKHCREALAPTKYPRSFCSRACRNRATNRQRMKPRAICALCGKPAPSPRQKACSAKCAYTLRKLKTRKPLTCKVCQREYFSKGAIRLKYCSKRCYDVVRCAKAWVEGNCDRCGKAFRRRSVRTRPTTYRFCSRECSSGFIAGDKHAWWRGGSDPNRGAKWTRLAESIRKRDGHVCQRCGTTQAENKERLAVDHIRPWRSFEDKVEANDPANLTSLCKKCHGYKTTKIEKAWLRGDVLALHQYERAVKLPPLFAKP
jgi:5-methylcytosine-specific restriction endonuclease McrA/predicted nucleic acid-binding Zn ribbon protein